MLRHGSLNVSKLYIPIAHGVLVCAEELNVCFESVGSSCVFFSEHMQVQVYDLASMSCSYVLSGHTGIVLCLDTCISSSGKSIVVTGSKDNSVSLFSPLSWQ